MVASLVVGLSCSDDADADDAVPTTATASTAPGVVPPAPSTVPPPATTTTLAGLPLPSVPVSVLIDQLVPAVDAGDEGYARAQFGVGWVDADGDGCDTRDEVLIAESVSPAEVDPSGCVVLAGDWVSPYDGHATPDPSELEVDHVVDLAEAWRSGAWAWTPERRVAYANDLDNPGTLVAVTAATNRSKRDRDPTSWQPPDGDSWCAYAAAWAQTKTTWGLTADPGEVAALRAITISC